MDHIERVADRADRRRARWWSAVVVVAALAVAACGSDGGSTTTDASGAAPGASGEAAGGSFPVVVEGANGRVEVPARPERIVSLSASLTEMLFAIDAGDQVEAVDAYSNYPEEAPVTDLSAFRPNVEAVAAYDPDLLTLPAAIVLNKADLANPDEIAQITTELTTFGLPVMTISALEGDGIDELRRALFELLPDRPVLPATKVRRITEGGPGLSVKRTPEGWVVSGHEIEQIVARFDTGNREAVSYLAHHFRKLGLNKALKQAGARDGDDVFLGDAVFEYFDETAAPQPEEEADDAVVHDDDLFESGPDGDQGPEIDEDRHGGDEQPTR